MMPLAEMFAPDINIQTARSVYPTAAGGTTASAGGAMTANSVTVVPDASGSPSAVVAPTAGAFSTSGRPLLWWIGFIGLLIFMVWVARKAGGDDEFRNIKPTFYNFMAITLTAIVGIVGLKVIAARWRIPGASDVIMAV